MRLLRTEPLLLGLNFFEYQKSTLKASGFELQFGMFALGDNSTATVSMFGMRVGIWCLVIIEPVAWVAKPVNNYPLQNTC